MALEELDAALDAPEPALSPTETVERAERWRLRSDLRRYLERPAAPADMEELPRRAVVQ